MPPAADPQREQPAQTKSPFLMTTMNSIACALGRLAAIVWLLFPHPVHAGAPTDQVRATADKVLEILNDPELASQAAKEERRNRLRQVIYPRFDFAEMARRSLGSNWRRITAAEQREFVKLFTEMLEQAYVNNIESYRGERIVYGREIQEHDFSEVDTEIITPRGEEIAVNYRLHRLDGEWKVYDVVIENVSLVNNYRSQFSRFLAAASFEELLDKIREKIGTSP
jgi:phospholipid transport system substrate-binding protein